MKIGYIRVSSAEQNTARQEVLMEQLSVDEVYQDGTISCAARKQVYVGHLPQIAPLRSLKRIAPKM